MKIGILQTGSVPPELLESHGEYADMFRRLLQAADPDFTVENWNVNEDHHIPSSPQDADGWLITGSKHGVYEDHPWIEPLKAFLREAYDAAVPIVGICFGHQILAEALGGKVEKSERGWGCGVHRYRVTEAMPWMQDASDTVAVHAMHQDQVVSLPPDAKVLAETPFCPYAALVYDDIAFSLQPHPEFDAAFEHNIISKRRGSLIPDEIAEEALASLESGTDGDLVGRWIASFFRQAEAKRKAA